MSSQSVFNFTIGEMTVVASDPCARKSRGNKLSAEAHEKIKHGKEEKYKAILALLRSQGGMTSKEIAAAFGTALHKVSPRLSELKQMKWIEPTGESRDGAAVLISNR
jgi:DNA-binding MarR family transcriptional regulator